MGPMGSFPGLTLSRIIRSPLAVLLIAGVALAVARFAIADLTPSSDGASYIETAHFLGGEEGAPLHQHRILKPLAPLGILLIERVAGVSGQSALLIESLIGFAFLLLAGWWFFREFFAARPERDTLALTGAILLAGGYPILKYGLDLYTETGAMAFFVGCAAATVRAARDPSWRNVLCATAIGVVGMLWKEYSALTLVSLGLAILVARELSWSEKFFRWSAMAGIGALVFGAWVAHVYVSYQYSYLDWFKLGGASGTLPLDNGSVAVVKSLLGIGMLAWLPAIGGVAKWRAMSGDERRIAIILAIPCLAIFTWGFAISRLYYVAAPMVLVFALHGLSRMMEGRPWVLPAATVLVLGSDFAWLAVSDILRPFIVSLFA